MLQRSVARQWLGSVLLSCALAASALAQEISLEASVDRSVVRENESFTFILRAVGQVRYEPDFTTLGPSFDVLQRYRKNRKNTGEQTELITEWLLQLMPKTRGKLTLLPISFAGAISNPIEIEVLPALAGEPPADVFLEVQATPSNPHLQSQVIYVLRLFRAISTGRSVLTPPPKVVGGEAIIERMGSDREYEVVRGERNFAVIERRYAIFPQTMGELTIEPVTFEAVLTERSGLATVQRFRSAPVALTVQPPPPSPAEFSGAAWVPAQELALSERWEAGAHELIAGSPQTRTVIMEAEGLLESQLPELRLPRVDGVRQYAEQPQLSRETMEDGLRAKRIERIAVIAQSPGEIELPAVELPWWNAREQRWEVARLESRKLIVTPNPAPTLPATGAAGEDSIEEMGLTRSDIDRLWHFVSGGLAVAWLATLALWWRSKRRGSIQQSFLSE